MTVGQALTVGVLALQGAFREHVHHLRACVVEDVELCVIEVRTVQELDRCHALVIPGGESTAISLIAQRTNLLRPLMDFVRTKPVWGTCAGLIFLSTQVVNGVAGQQLLGGLDIEVTRNAFGRQTDSFVAPLDFSAFIAGETQFPTFFIRAPVVSKILTDQDRAALGSDPDIVYSKNDYANPAPVEVLHRLDNGLLVAVRQGNKLGTSFHPELAPSNKFHRWFLTEFVVKHYQ